MANIFLTTDQHGAAPVATLANADTLIQLGGISASNDSGHGVVAQQGDNRISISGTVIARDNAVDMRDVNDSVSNSTLTIGEDASVISATLNGVQLNGSGNSVSNNGVVEGRFGIQGFEAPDSEIKNHGRISGQEHGVVLNGAGSTLINRGLVEGLTDNGVYSYDGTGGVSTVVNYGTISGQNTAVTALNTMVIENRGTLSGDVVLGATGDSVTNSGHVGGNVRLGDGNDVFDGTGGTVSGMIRGGAGNDVYTIDDAGAQIVEAANEGFDMIRSYISFTLPDEVEQLAFLGAANLVGNGNGSHNAFFGNLGNDTFYGGGGNDAFHGSVGADTYFGGRDGDRIDYSDSAGWVNVSLLTGFTGGGSGSQALGDSFTGIESLVGSFYDDRLSGDHGANLLAGGGGDDILRGRSGGDTLEGGAGRDTLDYADSAGFVNVSLLTGFAGGGRGSHALGDIWTDMEDLIGSRFADRLNGDSLNNVIEGGAGADIIDGNNGNDTLSYAGSAGFVNVSLVTGYAGGGSGSHAIGDTWTSMESLIGSAFDDRLTGDAGANRMTGGAGNDTLRGGDGADEFHFRTDNFGRDIITDFTDGTDMLVMSDLLVGGPRGHAIVDAGADAILTDNYGNSITLNGMAGLFDASDIVLV